MNLPYVALQLRDILRTLISSEIFEIAPTRFSSLLLTTITIQEKEKIWEKINPAEDHFCRISSSHDMQNASVRVAQAVCLKCQGFLLKSITMKNLRQKCFLLHSCIYVFYRNLATYERIIYKGAFWIYNCWRGLKFKSGLYSYLKFCATS